MPDVPVLAAVPGQDRAVGYLALAVARPHHAYLLAGPEGGGKQQAARAFAVLRDHGLAESLGNALADDARQHVVDTASRERHDEFDRMVRERPLSFRQSRQRQCTERRKNCDTAIHGGPLFSVYSGFTPDCWMI